MTLALFTDRGPHVKTFDLLILINCALSTQTLAGIILCTVEEAGFYLIIKKSLYKKI